MGVPPLHHPFSIRSFPFYKPSHRLGGLPMTSWKHQVATGLEQSPIPVPCCWNWSLPAFTPIVWPRFGGKSSPYMELLGTTKIDYTTIFLVKVTKKSQPLSDKNSTHRCALSFDIKTEDLSHARHVHGWNQWLLLEVPQQKEWLSEWRCFFGAPTPAPCSIKTM